MKTLGLVVSTDPASGDCARAARIALAARARGLEVGLFLMDRAVPWACDDAAVGGLVAEGCDVVACGTSLAALGAGPLAAGVVEGNQDDHAALVARADRVLAFT